MAFYDIKDVGSRLKSVGSAITSGRFVDWAKDRWDNFRNGRSNEIAADNNKNTNETNLTIARENLEYQRENDEYQRALQQKIFDREDSAYQRTVQDMRAAGVSPLVMQGTNNAGEAIATTPLNNDYKAQQMQQPLPSGFADLIPDVVPSVLGIIKSVADDKRNNAELDALELDNKYKEQTLADRVSAEKVSSQMKEVEKIMLDYKKADAAQKRIYDVFYHLNDGMTEKERLGNILRYSFGDNSSISPTDVALPGLLNLNNETEIHSKTPKTPEIKEAEAEYKAVEKKQQAKVKNALKDNSMPDNGSAVGAIELIQAAENVRKAREEANSKSKSKKKGK